MKNVFLAACNSYEKFDLIDSRSRDVLVTVKSGHGSYEYMQGYTRRVMQFAKITKKGKEAGLDYYKLANEELPEFVVLPPE